MGLLDVITSPVASAIGSVVNGISNYFSTKETNRTNAGINAANIEFNREEAQKSRDWSEKMWNQENEYNSPSNQLKLLRDAGLSPVNFETSISPAGSPPSGAQASAPSSIPMQSTNAGIIDVLAASQARLANAQADKAESEAERTKTLLPGELDVQGMTLALGREDIQLKQVEREKLKADMRETESNIRNLDERTNNLIKERSLLSLSIDEKKVFLKDFEKRLYNELLLQRSKLRMDDYQCRYISSQIALNASQIEVNNQTASNLYDVHLLNGVELKYKDKSLKLAFDTQTNEYNLSVIKGIAETRKAARRADNSGVGYVLNTTLDYFDTLTSIVGNCFGGAIESHFSYHK